MLLQRCLRRAALMCDASLVSLPSGVERCDVYRNVVSLDEEELIYEELSLLLEKEGQPLVLQGSTPQAKRVKNTCIELVGEEYFTEVKNSSKKEVRHVPGLLWSPTLMKLLSDVTPALMNCKPDAGRVLEHNLPGYEFHTEHPTVGSAFLYLNLLSDTVLEFDDEATARRGQVYLPARSLMRVSDEARWGFRFGELSEEEHTFVHASGAARRVPMDMRMSVQVWKLTPSLMDNRLLQERLEEALVVAAASGRIPSLQRDDTREEDEREAMEALAAPGTHNLIMPHQDPSPSAVMQSFVTAAMKKDTALRGSLGGDLHHHPTTLKTSDSKKMMSQLGDDYQRHKEQFSQVQGVLQQMKAMEDAGQPVNEAWLTRQISSSEKSADPERDKMDGFDSQDMQGTWDRADAKARFYKAKLKTMDYDGTAFLESSMPDLSQQTPLDMQDTIRKLAPHVRDGDKFLSSLPGGKR